MTPQWDKLAGARMACSIEHIGDRTLAILVFDKDVSETEWVYAFAINPTGQGQLRQVLDVPGARLTIPGSCWADALAYISTGELPSYAGKELGSDE